MAARVSRSTGGRLLLGAAGGLVAAALMTGSGALLALFWSRTFALAVLGSVIGMATVVCWPVLLLRVLSWHLAATAVVQFALMMTVAVLFGDAVLDRRGVRVTAEVAEIRTETSQPSGAETYVCRLRLPDGTSADLGCGADTSVGARFAVYQDPAGLVPPRRSVRVTDEQYVRAVGVGSAMLVALGAAAGVRAATARSD